MWVKATISFLIVFLLAFVLGGWFLMPFLPPVPNHPVTVFEAEYWTTNWAGAVLGLVLGGLSARSVVRKQRKAMKQG
jgi:membrane associated rhomboid family serine protease